MRSSHYNIGMIPDWQLPPGVDRGLHDYMNSGEMVSGYDAMMAASPLASFDVAFCTKWFDKPGSLIDFGCGTGRLCIRFAKRGFNVTGVDLSEVMLERARMNWAYGASSIGELAHLPRPGRAEFLNRNLVDATPIPGEPFDYAACLFSTLGMVKEHRHRATVLANVFRSLKPGGRFVLHVHNRHFRGLAGKGRGTGDVTMPQAYGGAALTLHHFSRCEVIGMLTDAGFRVLEVLPVGTDGPLPARWWMSRWRAYGYLIAAERLK